MPVDLPPGHAEHTATANDRDRAYDRARRHFDDVLTDARDELDRAQANYRRVYRAAVDGYNRQLDEIEHDYAETNLVVTR